MLISKGQNPFELRGSFKWQMIFEPPGNETNKKLVISTNNFCQRRKQLVDEHEQDLKELKTNYSERIDSAKKMAPHLSITSKELANK